MNWFTRSLHAAWGLFAWIGFGLCVLFSLIVTLLVPGAARRQKLVTWAAKMVFVIPRVPVTVTGMDNLPTDNCVVVANHASYIDGIVLKGYLPWRFSFVIKGEMRNFGPAHFVLRRSGSKFVERNEITGSTRDARQIVKAAQGGESLGFFPEGTFREEPGVDRFRPGAFVAAFRAGMPVVPIAISGSRHILPSKRLLPRPGPLRIDILPAIAPGDEDFVDARHLGEAARQRILAVLDEPDIADRA